MPAVQLTLPDIDIEKEVRDAIGVLVESDIDEAVRRALEEQSWYRKYANTVNSTVGIASTVAATVLSLGLDLPGWVTASLVAVGALGTILGVSRTTNGIQPQTASQLRNAVSR